MRRLILGVLSILLLAAGGLLLAGLFTGASQAVGAACLRMGILLGLVWLAEPQLRRLPAWMPIAILALAILLALRPRLFPLALLAVGLLWLVRPRWK